MRNSDFSGNNFFLSNFYFSNINIDNYNFNYLGFNLPANTIQGGYPAASFEIRDGAAGNPQLTATAATGQSWVIRVLHTDGKNYSYLLTSTGIQCKNKTKANITFAACGAGSEAW